jgi:hypothetical protein
MITSMFRRAWAAFTSDPTPGYQEEFDGGTATTSVYPYVVNGENASFVSYNTNLDGGQATNPA